MKRTVDVDLDEATGDLLRLAGPDDLDPSRTPYVSLWERTADDPDPMTSPVLGAFDRFVDAVSGHEDAFWTAIHRLCGQVPPSAAVPAPARKVRRAFVWDDEQVFLMTASPAWGIRVHFPPKTPQAVRLRLLEGLTRLARSVETTSLADRVPSQADYAGRDWWRSTQRQMAGKDEPIGAVALEWIVEPRHVPSDG